MKNLLLAAMLFSTLLFTSCKDEDNSTTPTQTAQDPIVGTWISDNVDVAFGLKYVSKTKKIVATFKADQTYSVVAVDSSGSSVTYTGTYKSTDSKNGTIKNIVLNQSLPTNAVANGIFQIDNRKNLWYEVIQTTPALTGYTAPVADSGFGSTKYNGANQAYWVQKFVPENPATEPLIGNWLSDGNNVAFGLKYVSKTKKITATFTGNTYKVVSTDSSGATVNYEGTYTTKTVTGTSVRTITLNQTLPTTAVADGIYQVTASGLLNYEVIQVNPALPGYTAPTVTDGFGSTKYNGNFQAIWIQKFVLQ